MYLTDSILFRTFSALTSSSSSARHGVLPLVQPLNNYRTASEDLGQNLYMILTSLRKVLQRNLASLPEFIKHVSVVKRRRRQVESAPEFDAGRGCGVVGGRVGGFCELGYCGVALLLGVGNQLEAGGVRGGGERGYKEERLDAGEEGGG